MLDAAPAGVRKVRAAVNPDSTFVYLVPLGGGQIAEVLVSSAVASPAFDAEMRALSERWQDTPPTAIPGRRLALVRSEA